MVAEVTGLRLVGGRWAGIIQQTRQESMSLSALPREPRMHIGRGEHGQGLLITDRFAVTAAVSGGDLAVVAAALGLAGDGCACAVPVCAGCFAPCVASAASLPAGALT